MVFGFFFSVGVDGSGGCEVPLVFCQEQDLTGRGAVQAEHTRQLCLQADPPAFSPTALCS